MSRFLKKALFVLFSILGGVLTFWAVMPTSEIQKYNRLAEIAVCTLEVSAEIPSASATFTATQHSQMFHVGMRQKEHPVPISITITCDRGLIANVSLVQANHFFGLGHNVPPGIYTVTLGQEPNGQGASLVIATEKPVYTTGWQIWSRVYVAMLLLSGIWVIITRKSDYVRRRENCLYTFQLLLLGFLVIFIYLLFHEGGHALAEIYFGRFDLVRSDFWGIHGHPHSGGMMGPGLEPWQQTVISCAGPMLPTIAGFALFILWISFLRKYIRASRPILKLYITAIIAMLIFPDTVLTPLYLLSFIRAEGDLIGFVSSTDGPVWIFRGLLLAVSFTGAVFLWYLIPEFHREFKVQFLLKRSC